VSLEVCSSNNPYVSFKPSDESSDWRQWNTYAGGANTVTPNGGSCSEAILPTGADGAVLLIGQSSNITVILKGYIKRFH